MIELISLAESEDVRRRVSPNASPLFHSTITPHQSLTRRGLAITCTVILVVSALLQIGFARNGFWPIAAFLAADTIFLLFALVAARSRLNRQEDVVLSQSEIAIRRTQGGRQYFDTALPLFGLSLHANHDPDYGCQSLILKHRGRHIEIARDLSPSERADFRDAIVDALERTGCRPRQTFLKLCHSCPTKPEGRHD